MSAPSIPPGFDFTDPALWETRNPVQEFAELRRTAPVWWNPQTDAQSGGVRDGGYWVVTKHEDIKEISHNPALFSSQQKGSIIRLPGQITIEQIELTSALLVNVDPPKHSKIRRIISKGFSPRAVEGLRAHCRTRSAADRSARLRRTRARAAGWKSHPVAVKTTLTQAIACMPRWRIPRPGVLIAHSPPPGARAGQAPSPHRRPTSGTAAR
ncbi:hypothetical protein ACQP2U_28495 [Nocardia sp. CA-084685]|uniref:hypothetical protein n=1 Tax=Nocardia sp. CA-084685 TaxID=3239970 RepID=UPI003D95303C